MLGRSGGYIPESAAQQHIMRPFISAIAYLHARASDYSPGTNLFGTMCPHLQLSSSHKDIVASQPLQSLVNQEDGAALPCCMEGV